VFQQPGAYHLAKKPFTASKYLCLKTNINDYKGNTQQSTKYVAFLLNVTQNNGLIA